MIGALYSFSIWCYAQAVAMAGLFHPKAKDRHRGSKGWRTQAEELQGQHPIWFHCASVGEYEQAKPVIQAIRSSLPNQKILLSFFSPSGYNAFKRSDIIDGVAYFPVDRPSECREWVAYFQPAAAVFVKYEYWFNMMQALSDADVPMFLISAHFPADQYLMKWPGSLLFPRLNQFNKIFVQDHESAQRLQARGVHAVEVVGDTRIDRVLDVCNESFDQPWVERFAKGAQVLVMGSVWPADSEAILSNMPAAMDPALKLIVAPHNVGDECLHMWQQQFGNELVRWSETDRGDPHSAKVLFVDEMGWLSRLYRFGSTAYVGGGFGTAVHNTLEAAVYGIPVVFGPANQRFLEIQELKALKAGIEVRNGEELWDKLLELHRSPEKRSAIQTKLEGYFEERRGATKRIEQCLRAQLA